MGVPSRVFCRQCLVQGSGDPVGLRLAEYRRQAFLEEFGIDTLQVVPVDQADGLQLVDAQDGMDLFGQLAGRHIEAGLFFCIDTEDQGRCLSECWRLESEGMMGEKVVQVRHRPASVLPGLFGLIQAGQTVQNGLIGRDDASQVPAEDVLVQVGDAPIPVLG